MTVTVSAGPRPRKPQTPDPKPQRLKRAGWYAGEAGRGVHETRGVSRPAARNARRVQHLSRPLRPYQRGLQGRFPALVVVETRVLASGFRLARMMMSVGPVPTVL
eukprot:1154755-Rhodomonas_salina.1